MTESKSFAKREITPHLALVMVQVMFGTWPIIGKIALRYISSFSLVGFRILGAAVVFTLLRQQVGRLRTLPIKTLGLLVLCSVLGVAINQFFFVKGLSLTTVINASLITTTIPVSTLVVSIMLGHDRASLTNILGIGLAGAGVIYLIDPFRATFSSDTTLGNLLIAISSLSYGAYIPLSKGLVKRYGALDVITWLFLIATFLTLPLALYSWTNEGLDQIPIRAWLSVLYIILVPTLGAYYLNAWALGRVSPSVVATYIYLQPLLAFGLGPLVLGEQLNVRTLISCVLIFAGVAIVTVVGRSRAVEEVSEHPEAMGH